MSVGSFSRSLFRRFRVLLLCVTAIAHYASGQVPLEDRHFLADGPSPPGSPPPAAEQTFRFESDASGDSRLAWRARAGWLYRAFRSADGLAWLPLQDHYQAGLPGVAASEARLPIGAVNPLPPGLASPPAQRTIININIQPVAGTAAWPNAGSAPAAFRFGAWIRFQRPGASQINYWIGPETGFVLTDSAGEPKLGRAGLSSAGMDPPVWFNTVVTPSTPPSAGFVNPLLTGENLAIFNEIVSRRETIRSRLFSSELWPQIFRLRLLPQAASSTGPVGNAVVTFPAEGAMRTVFLEDFDLSRLTAGQREYPSGFCPWLDVRTRVNPTGLPGDLPLRQFISPSYNLGVSVSVATAAGAALEAERTAAQANSLSLAQLTAGQRAVLDRLLWQKDRVKAALWAPPQPAVAAPPPPPTPYDDRSRPNRSLYKVQAFLVDTDGDGVADPDEMVAAVPTDPYDDDTDNDGVPNAWELPSPGVSPNGEALPAVIISEFCADNRDSLRDEDGNSPDWIEIYNGGSTAVDLEDLAFTCSRNRLADWDFPPGTVQLQPGQYLVVACAHDDDNPTTPNAQVPAPAPLSGYRATIKLRATPAEFLGLTWRDSTGSRSWLDQYRPPQEPDPDTPNFAPQHLDISFGRFQDVTRVSAIPGGELAYGYFDKPTPGARNALHGYEGVCRELDGENSTKERALIKDNTSQTLNLSSLTPGSTIVYTINGAEPTAWSEVFPGSLTIRRDLVPRADGSPGFLNPIVRARAVKAGWLPGRVSTHSFIYLDNVVGTAAEGTLPVDHQRTPPGYPVRMVNSTLQFNMDPEQIRDRRAAVREALRRAPTVCITVPVADFFDYDRYGCYAWGAYSYLHQTDPTGQEWRRRATFEWLGPAYDVLSPPTAAQIQQWYGDLATVQFQAPSLVGVSGDEGLARQGLRVEFTGGDDATRRPRIPLVKGQPGYRFQRLKLRVPGDHTIGEIWTKAAEAILQNATNANRLVHVYYNGLYWGLAELTEPLNDDFLTRRFVNGPWAQYEDGQFTPAVVQWQDIFGQVPADRDDNPASTFASLANGVDLPVFARYTFLNDLFNTGDWTDNNYYLARRQVPALPPGQGDRLIAVCKDVDNGFKPPADPDDDWYLQSVINAQGWNISTSALRHSPRYRILVEQAAVAMNAFLAVPPAGSSPAQVLWDQLAAETSPLMPADAARWNGYLPTPVAPEDPPRDPLDRWQAGLASARAGALNINWQRTLQAYREAALLPDLPAPTASAAARNITLQTTTGGAVIRYLVDGAAGDDPYAAGTTYSSHVPFPAGQTNARVRARVLLPVTISGSASYRWSPQLDVTLTAP